MPTVERPGKKVLYVELPEELVDRFEKFLNGRSKTAEVALALTRHMDYPPEITPLPQRKAKKKK